ncbi:MAG: hypothetical protein DHS20C15_29850 [Planctomycetota bacterium]|nr:MAG: hypothetical protein DHS20C15_29850 [Planctomycetota bacterium]
MSHDGVFHPNHDELHGQTVVVRTSGPHTLIGRWHEVREGQVLMMDVAKHDASAAEESADDWVARIKKFGIPVDERSASVAQASVTEVVRLRDA